MKTTGTTLKGYTIKDGKVVKIPGYALNASAKIAQAKSKKIRVGRNIG